MHISEDLRHYYFRLYFHNTKHIVDATFFVHNTCAFLTFFRCPQKPTILNIQHACRFEDDIFVCLWYREIALEHICFALYVYSVIIFNLIAYFKQTSVAIRCNT